MEESGFFSKSDNEENHTKRASSQDTPGGNNKDTKAF
jgi:hypothetical protein